MKFKTIWGDATPRNIMWLFQKYGVPRSTIEIGVFEGNTTFNMVQEVIQHYPEYRHYAIDPYGESDDLKDEVVSDAKALFLENLADFENRDSITFINDYSTPALLQLIRDNVQVDFIFIDGDHRASTVLDDLVLSFQLLKVGGVILCDDCTTWRQEKLQNMPRLAVDGFIHSNIDRIEVLEVPSSFQVAFRKI